MRGLRLPGDLSAPAARPGVLAALRAAAPGLLHVVDPYKVPVAEAAAKAAALARLGHPALLVGSTDNPAFDAHVAPYVAELRRHTDRYLVLHFPPVRGRGAPVCPGADAVLLHVVLDSADPYPGAAADTARAVAELPGPPVVLRSASFAFGPDPKTAAAAGANPSAEDPAALAPYLDAVAGGDFDLAYLLSRHGRVSRAVCRLFRARLGSRRLLFVGGGVRTAGRVRAYADSGADWVVAGTALERPDWRRGLADLADPRPPTPRRSGAAGGGAVRRRAGGRAELAAALQDGLARPVGVGDAERAAYATNVGGVDRRLPAVVARAGTAAEVAHVLRTARAAGAGVGLRGSGHSFGAQALSDGGVLLVLEPGDPDVTVHPDGTAELSARTTWQRAEAALNARGRAVPVLTNHLAVTVGGTLAVGGYGEGTVAHGGQVDLVARLRLIRPDGGAVWCGPGERPELYRYGLASLGALGVLDRVVLRTVPYAPLATIAVRRLPTLRALVAAAGRLAAAPVDLLSGQHYEGGFLATYGVRGDRPLPPALARGAAVRTERDRPLRSLREARRNPADPDRHFLWTDYCLPLAAADAFAAFVQERVLADPAYARYRGRVLLLAAGPAAGRPGLPFAPATGLAAGPVLGFGLYFAVPRGDAAGVARVQGLHRAALAACLAGGGRPYLAGWYELDGPTLRALYGADPAALRALRAALDPAGRFNPGPLS
ncbi:hypothetical protein GCM10010123_40620 [Pilimelia anulata]|uniref:FAD-binding PCMH-type domain-containing protein n=1 Tax=Pilimelia anulata TaxID=53371 RepID=A0A8J3BAL8_9ACTN|nr:geranylgeranylglyceryl/heptaprenylglyceryl phosphate synthase [Pilimelia anulata]GGK06725.1 hypothetical protein GCM10010123_40620 [Pilimelia anulata]